MPMGGNKLVKNMVLPLCMFNDQHVMGIILRCVWWGNPPPPPQQPISGTADPELVKQDKSSGAPLTPPKHVRPRRVGMCSGKRPIAAAKGKQPKT